jgi:cytochrome c553
MIIKVLGACVLVALSSAAAAAGDAEAGRIKANTCMGCHGIPNYTNVYPTYRVPKLGGQGEGLLVAALKAYKSGERPHKTMHAQAVTLSEQDMADIAAYLNQAPAHRDGRPSPGRAAAAIKQAETCQACHGPNGAKPVLPDAPILAGQYRNYLEHALREYKSGARKNPVMGPQGKMLSDADIEALAEYFDAQQSPLYTPSVHGAGGAAK